MDFLSLSLTSCISAFLCASQKQYAASLGTSHITRFDSCLIDCFAFIAQTADSNKINKLQQKLALIVVVLLTLLLELLLLFALCVSLLPFLVSCKSN